MDRHDKKRATMAANLETQTGVPMATWVSRASDSGLERFNDIVAWLKTEHGLGHFQARLIAEEHRDAEPD